uniref:Uncharacterized protein n=1 Tax=Phyllymenia taiwanensis TaxID=1260292 RepID=R9XYN5_9FLOR|nr:hypothetical protein [Grateloupia taiwanensis]AGO19781.1 hypothetical protein [Grateloupia taiwanensis]
MIIGTLIDNRHEGLNYFTIVDCNGKLEIIIYYRERLYLLFLVLSVILCMILCVQINLGY